MGISLPESPATYHEKNHEGVFQDCWRCGRARARCCAKRRFNTRELADTAVKEINEREEFALPLTRYRCRWCLAWHLTKATTKIQIKRSEKARRKWLLGQMETV